MTLTPGQRDRLTHLIRAGSSPAYQQFVARVLLKLDRSQPEHPPSDEQIAEALEISRRTVLRLKERFAKEGLDATWAASILKRASWLNIAEIELSVLVRQGLAHNSTTMQEECRAGRTVTCGFLSR